MEEMDNKIIEAFLRSITETENLTGRDIEFASDFKEKLKDDFVLEADTLLKNDDIRLYIRDEYLDNLLLLTTIKTMIFNGEITINFTDKAEQKNIDYIKKLVK